MSANGDPAMPRCDAPQPGEAPLQLESGNGSRALVRSFDLPTVLPIGLIRRRASMLTCVNVSIEWLQCAGRAAGQYLYGAQPQGTK
jgi:hypothetical protein